MKTFEELKERLISKALDHECHDDFYKRSLSAGSKRDLLEAITDGWDWVKIEVGIVDLDFLVDNFTEDELLGAGIYTHGIHDVKGKAFVLGSATVYAHNPASITACDSATVYVSCDESREIAVWANDKSTVYATGEPKVVALDYAAVYAYDNVTVNAFDHSIIHAYDNAAVDANVYSYAVVHDSATFTVSGRAKVYKPLKDEIYVKKGLLKVIASD